MVLHYYYTNTLIKEIIPIDRWFYVFDFHYKFL